MRRAVVVGLVVAAATLAVLGAATPTVGTASSASAVDGLFPAVIPLPDGFQPEGIVTGRGTSFYVGSLRDGAIYRGDLRTGEGRMFVTGEEGRQAVGLEIDHRNRIFVAGGSGGGAAVYDAATGVTLATYQFPGDTGFVNDAVVTPDAVYFTDSMRPSLYVVPLGPGGRLGEQASVRAMALTGDFAFREDGSCSLAPGVNANGIETSPDGRRLLVVQFNTGLLFSVDPATGVARTVDLGGASLECGDGLLRRGRTLYAVQGASNQIAVVRLDSSPTSGVLVRTITDPDLDIPATIAPFGPFLYAVNGRFSTPPTTDTPYQVVRLPAY